MTQNKQDMIKELEKIRIRLTQIYMEFGNNKGVQADLILNQDIRILEESTNE